MHNWITVRLNTFLRIGLVGIVFWSGPSCIRSQGGSLTQRARASAGQPFVGLNDSLARTADTLLVSANQTAPPASVVTNGDKAANIFPSKTGDQRSRFSGHGAPSAATMRLNLLRATVEPILTSHGVPPDLAAVILVESGGRADALSPKGARGLWQLMPATARRYGLRVDEVRDDRVDLLRATNAAAGYLHDLYAQFGDWKLALAAYNTGEGNVSSAILRAHTQDFDQLTSLRVLPLETRNYVPRVLATAQFIGLSSTPGENRMPARAITVFAVSNP